ncbi:MAG: hypothetical protein ABI383_01325 [Acidobacteriaceae bacterium]
MRTPTDGRVQILSSLLVQNLPGIPALDRLIIHAVPKRVETDLFDGNIWIDEGDLAKQSQGPPYAPSDDPTKQ